MTDLYSPLLALAIAAVVASLGAALVRRPRLGIATGIAALLLVALAATSHVIFGHAPGSASAFGLLAFLGQHPALWVTAAVGAVGLLHALRTAGTP